MIRSIIAGAVGLAGLTLMPAAGWTAPITLICKGEVHYYRADNGVTSIDGETAILDLDAGTFRPPFYVGFPLLRIETSSVDFGADTGKISTYGNLDRVSGSLTMTVMETAARAALKAGRSAKALVWMSAKCHPAQRMF
jgi:hypothetical protein